jgi:glycosyltransferase involved in cell wall biosynthesis
MNSGSLLSKLLRKFLAVVAHDAPGNTQFAFSTSSPEGRFQKDVRRHMSNTAMRLTYATTADPGNVRAWSGTVYHLARALEAQDIAVDCLGELAKARVLLNRAINKLSTMARLGEIPVERTERMAELFARRIGRHLETSRSDMVFSPSSLPIARLRTPRPKVFYTDATFAGILASDPSFKHYPASYLAEGHALEQSALSNCDLAIYASQWSARTAREHYEVADAKIRVVPFGANLTTAPAAPEVVRLVQARSDRLCELLFMGVNWTNKGGPKALEVARLMNRRGIRSRLHVVGCVPPVSDLPDWVVVHGFIGKETPAGRDRLARLIGHSHFLVLPTLADCFGLVLCEANAFGVPCLANDVGGVGEVVKPGLNGYLLAPGAPAGDWVDRMGDFFGDRASYGALASRSRVEFESRLNWQVAGTAIRRHLDELL